jgi:3-methyladenine DNA glycosylase AlkD
LIQNDAGQATQHTFSDSYLGNNHPRFAINAPTLRRIAKDWVKENKGLSPSEYLKTIDSLIHGESATEKMFAGMLLDLSTDKQRAFDPTHFDKWLDQLVGWAEIDSMCTGDYTSAAIPENFSAWKNVLLKFSKSKNINKRRASLVFLCSPLRQATDERLATLALENIDRLKGEKEILITRAVSWLLRSMVPYHRKTLENYLKKNEGELPAIAVRETQTKLRTGKKTAKA